MRTRIELLYVYYMSSVLYGLEPLFMENFNLKGLEPLYNKVIKVTLSVRSQVKDEKAKIIAGILPLEQECATRSIKYLCRLHKRGSITENSLNLFWNKLKDYTLNFRESIFKDFISSRETNIGEEVRKKLAQDRNIDFYPEKSSYIFCHKN